MAAARGNTKTITVSFPVELAEQAANLARSESRTMSELLREAFRSYRAAAVRQRLEEGHEYARRRKGEAGRPADVESLVSQVRLEVAKEQRASKRRSPK